MRHPLTLSSVFALLLLCCPLRPAAAATAVFQGKVTPTFFFTITYTPDGKIKSNKARDDQYKKDFANTLLLLSDDQQGFLGTVDDKNNGTYVAPPLVAIAADDKNTSFLLDGLNKDDKTLVSFHAYMQANPDDVKKSTAFGHIVELLADGTVNSTDVTLEVQSP